MDIFITVLLLVIGLVLIIKGGDFFVDAASWIAEVSGIPSIIVGATIVSLATTLPELLVSVIAAAQGNVEMAVGNAVGSVTANTGLIMGLSFVFAPFAIKRKDYWLKATILMVSVVMLSLLCMSGVLNMWLSLLLLVPFAIFFADNVLIAIKEMKANKAGALAEESAQQDAEIDAQTLKPKKPPVKKDKKTIIINIIKFVLGAAGIVIGARLLVDNATKIAVLLKIPEGIIAVTLVAIGTSLPELVTMITSLVKKNGSMSVGNIIGANIIDITLILPISALVAGKGLIISSASILLDLPFCFAIAAIGMIPSLFLKKFTRVQGIAMLLAYITYIALRIFL